MRKKKEKRLLRLGSLTMILLMLLGGTVSVLAAPGDSADAASAGEQASGYDLSYYQRFQNDSIDINVYNWGEYISDGSDDLMDVNAEFEELTGIKVNYTTYETNEAMYAKLKSGANRYDVIVPSDYMISRLIEESMIQPLDPDNIPNYKYIGEDYLSTSYDPDNRYSVPFAWGTVGIVYNPNMISEVNGWEDLWNEGLSGQILMFKNSRDAFGIALMRLGYSLNTEDPKKLEEAAELLRAQKPLVQAYVQDQIFDKMQSGEAAIAPCYVGDYLIMKDVNEELELYVPTPTNYFADACCIPSDARHKEAAEMYINFLNEPQVAADNMEYIVYSTPNIAAKELISEDYQEDSNLYPDSEFLAQTEAYIHLSEETNILMDELWADILSSEEGYSKWAMPLFLGGTLVLSIIIPAWKKRRRKKEESYEQ